MGVDDTGEYERRRKKGVGRPVKNDEGRERKCRKG